MLRVTDPQESLWWHLLPEEARTLPEHLAFVDSLLDDERFFAPFRERVQHEGGPPDDPCGDLHPDDVAQAHVQSELRDPGQGGFG